MVIQTDHAAMKWLLKFSGKDAMYHHWIAEMRYYMLNKIEARPKIKHGNADAMSKASRDCKFEECESHELHHR